MIESINEFSVLWADYFLQAVVQDSVFILGIFLILRLLRNRSAALLRTITLVGLAKVVAPPFLPAAAIEQIEVFDFAQVVGVFSVSDAFIPETTFSALSGSHADLDHDSFCFPVVGNLSQPKDDAALSGRETDYGRLRPAGFSKAKRRQFCEINSESQSACHGAAPAQGCVASLLGFIDRRVSPRNSTA